MDEIKVFAIFVLLVLVADAALFWLINNIVDEFDDIVTQNAALDTKLNLQLDELKAEAMQ